MGSWHSSRPWPVLPPSPFGLRRTSRDGALILRLPRPSRRRFAPPQRLSCLSSGLPFPFVPEHGVEGGEDLTGDGDEGDHFRLTGGKQAHVEGFEDRVVAGGGWGGGGGRGEQRGRERSVRSRARQRSCSCPSSGPTDE